MNKILVYGPRKSGTTLLQSLLDGHESIVFFPGELKIKEFYKFYKNNADLRSEYLRISHSFYNTNSNDSQDQQIIGKFFSLSDYHDELKNKSKSCHDLRTMIDMESKLFCQYLDKNSKYVGYKEVGGNTEYIIYLFKILFPEAKIILNKRDPKSIVSSIIRDRRRKDIHMSSKSIIGEVWEAFRINRYIDLLGSLGMGIFIVSYEDIINDTEKELIKISNYLDIDFDPILTIPTTLGVNIVPKTASVQTKKVIKTINKWTDGLTLREIVLIKSSALILENNPYKLEKF